MEEEESPYDVPKNPAKSRDRKISTEMDGVFTPIRTRTHAYTIVRPKKPDSEKLTERQRRESFELVEVKQAKLSTDISQTTTSASPRYTAVNTRATDVIAEEDDDLYNVPSLVRQQHVDDNDDDDEIYDAPSLSKPTRPVPELPEQSKVYTQGVPTRPPPSLPPPPILPPRTDLEDEEYANQGEYSQPVCNVT